MRLFQYAIFWVPSEEQKKTGSKAKILIPIKEILANDEASAQIQVSREIPDEYMDQLDQVTICVRPF